MLGWHAQLLNIGRVIAGVAVDERNVVSMDAMLLI
jgi:hypothetical protein